MSVVVTEPVTSGRVLLKTTVGEILIELWPREAPKACRNFVQLALEGYYDGLPFHRIVPGFIAQTGDATGTGTGGESIYDEGEFEDEFSQRLKFNRRGLVGMANLGRNTNLSQFFFTLDRADELNQRNTLFARVAAGDTLFNMLKLNEVEVEPGTDRPVYPPKVKSIQVLDNPFSDIVPRITPQERKEQEKAKRDMKAEKAKLKQQGKRKGTKNAALLSFGAAPEEEAPVDPELAKLKFKSAHDALDDGRLSKEVIDDRGTSATLPAWMEVAPPATASSSTAAGKKRANEDISKSGDEKRERIESDSLKRAKEAKSKASTSQSDKVKAEIAAVQADLLKMTRKNSNSSDEEGKTKKKRKGPSLLQLQREELAKKGSVKIGKDKGDKKNLESLFSAFGSKGKAATAQTKEKEVEVEEEVNERYGIEEDDDSDAEDWKSHRLKFRKDATLDQHSIDEYSVVDPLAKNTQSLAEMQEKKDSGARRYTDREGPGVGRGGGGGGGSRSAGIGHASGSGSRHHHGGGGGGDKDQRGSKGGQDYGRVRSDLLSRDWQSDRMKTSDLA